MKLNVIRINSSVIRQKVNLKTGVSRKQSTPNFPKNEHFLPPDTHMYVCVSGSKKCSFYGKFGVLFFFKNPFWDSPFCFFTDELYFKDLITTGYCILSVKIMTKYSYKYFLVLIIFYVCTFLLPKYCAPKSPHFPHANTQIPFPNWRQSIALVATCMFL